MNVAILILNYNGKDLLSSYLNSVVTHKEHAEVWVVDNGSTDDSLDFIKKNFPKVKILVLDKNYGYSKGYNLAVSKIDSDLYCFLNNDVRVSSNWVSLMQQLFETHPHLGFAQPKIVSDKEKSSLRLQNGSKVVIFEDLDEIKKDIEFTMLNFDFYLENGQLMGLDSTTNTEKAISMVVGRGANLYLYPNASISSNLPTIFFPSSHNILISSSLKFLLLFLYLCLPTTPISSISTF